MKTHLQFFAILLFGSLLSFEARSATFTITSNTNWSAISGGPPSIADIVTVKNGAILTIDISTAVCGGLYLGGSNPSGGDGTIVFNSGSVLTVVTATATVQVGSFAGSGYFGYIDMTNGGKLICNLLGYAFGTLTAGSGTLEFQSTTTFILPSAFTTYNNLTISNTGTIQLGVNTVLTGNLDILDGTFDTDGVSNYNLDISGDINIDASANFNANNSVITLEGNFTNDGTFNKGNSTLTFDGGGAQIITGNNINLYEIILNKSSGVLTLDIDVDADKIQLNNGNLLLDNCILRIAAVGMSGGGSSSYIITDGTSYIAEHIVATGSYTFHVGDATSYTPFTMTINSATFSGSDSVIMSVVDSKHPSMGTGDHISRYWNLDAVGFTALNYDVSYTYVDGDISGTESNMSSASWNGSSWTEYFPTNAAANTLFTVGGITTIPAAFAFSGGSASALPIVLASFTGENNNGMTILTWTTGTGNNNDYFSIERSIDGLSYEYLNRIEGAGNSLLEKDYSYTDFYPAKEVVYYRLSQTDFNGTTQYFPTIAVQNQRPASIPFKLYPNPIKSGEQFYVEFPVVTNINSSVGNEILVVLLDQMGKEVYSNIIVQQQDEVIIAFDTSEKLSPGMYFVIGSSNDEIYRHKLIIQ